MPTLTITKTYDDGVVLTEAMLDAIKSSIETWANTTKLDADNIQDGGISASNLATNAVTTVKIATAAVTEEKLATGSVSTAKIEDGAVTHAKLVVSKTETTDGTDPGSGGVCTSEASGQNSVQNATTQTITDSGGSDPLSCVLTTVGRPVRVEFIADTSGAEPGHVSTANGTANAKIEILRDSTIVHMLDATTFTSRFPVTALSFTDLPPAGTYTYTVKAGGDSTASVTMDDFKMRVYEI